METTELAQSSLITISWISSRRTGFPIAPLPKNIAMSPFHSELVETAGMWVILPVLYVLPSSLKMSLNIRDLSLCSSRMVIQSMLFMIFPPKASISIVGGSCQFLAINSPYRGNFQCSWSVVFSEVLSSMVAGVCSIRLETVGGDRRFPRFSADRNSLAE